MMNETQHIGGRTEPEISKISRFAMAVGLVLLAYVLAGGYLKTQVRSSLVDFIEFTRPWVILLFLLLTSVYASLRYWYYGIRMPITRTKVRKYLRQGKSLIVFKGTQVAYQVAVGQSTDPHVLAHTLLESRCPPGLTPYSFIVFTDAMQDPTEGYMRHLVANRVDRYYPGIVSDEIKLEDKGDYSWASVGNLMRGTWWRAVRQALRDILRAIDSEVQKLVDLKDPKRKRQKKIIKGQTGLNF